jgi:hypothetical protein
MNRCSGSNCWPSTPPEYGGKSYELLRQEAAALTAIFSASYQTARANLKKKKRGITKSPNL